MKFCRLLLRYGLDYRQKMTKKSRRKIRRLIMTGYSEIHSSFPPESVPVQIYLPLLQR